MSKLIHLRNVSIDRALNGAKSSVYTLHLSDGTKHEVLGSFTDTPEQIAQRVAEGLLEVNHPVNRYNVLPAHAVMLLKLVKVIAAKGENHVHRIRDMEYYSHPFTDNEKANLTFLHYHALAIPDKNGYWLITTRGGEFLRGERPIPKTSIYQGGERIGEEGEDVWIHDLLREKPEWPRRADFLIPANKREMVQAELAL